MDAMDITTIRSSHGFDDEDDQDEDCTMLLEHQDLLLPAMPWLDPERKLKEIRELQYRAGDIFICSYPKSGNHWVEKMLSLLLEDGKSMDVTASKTPLISFSEIKDLAARSSPRTFIMHLRYERLPKQHTENNGKIIVLVRNVKDTAVSLFHFQRRVGTQKKWVQWDYFLRKFLCGRAPYGSYFDFYRHWDAVMNDYPDSNITRLCYEELQKDCFNELKSLCKWFGVDRSDSAIRSVMSRCYFMNMKAALEAKTTNPIIIGTKEEPKLFRKGVVGDWKNHFTVAQSEDVDRLIAEKMKNSRFNVTFNN